MTEHTGEGFQAQPIVYRDFRLVSMEAFVICAAWAFNQRFRLLPKPYFQLILGLACAFILPLQSWAGGELRASNQTAEWGYSGRQGPEHWAESNSSIDYLCKLGESQSPINLGHDGSIHKRLQEDEVRTHYHLNHHVEIVRTIHGITVRYDHDNTLEVDGVAYRLDNVHFHIPSEHTIEHQYFDGEIHFVHFSRDGAISVIAIFMNTGKADNESLDYILTLAPEHGGHVELNTTKDLNPPGMLASMMSSHGEWDHYRYRGSLTTPPCKENVEWIVLEKPVEISHAQLRQLSALFPEENNRPIQRHSQITVTEFAENTIPR